MFPTFILGHLLILQLMGTMDMYVFYSILQFLFFFSLMRENLSMNLP